MDARERWQALQAHLSAARGFAQAGDRASALAHVERALEVDPDFLAAHSLRDQLTGGIAPPLDRRPSELATPAPSERSPVVDLEARARARRAERRLMAACDALASGDYKTAVIALDDARELGADPGDLLRVEQALAVRQPRRFRRRGRRFGPWFVAAATVAAGVLFASYIDEPGAIPAHGTITIEPVPPRIDATPPVATSGEAAPPGTASSSVAIRQDVTRASVIVTPAAAQPPEASVAHGEALSIAADARESSSAPSFPSAKPAVAPLFPSPPPAVAPPVAASSAVDPSSLPPAQLVSVQRPDDSGVRDVLQRYRTAYEQLNAKSARAVWPAVDERALARAFDGLESQRLNFDNCDVALQGDAATATCRGTTKFVPKVGSREPLVEPRTWQFTLKKGDGGWAIETARAER